ncbi:hypothetical protein [Oceanobacillus halophilus]|uniref:Uncharacterized protein n=1 Tax=Oceanobacillus halophilus TaxID=930130 RepID=A0A495A191_9BACI|nr:hypothetical protein [Oceanobacillus halophilus]RKQ32644.1 hypothetical protein D8M06_11945 [Oceanobacillus halophilus]
MGYILPINHYKNHFQKQINSRRVKQTIEKPYKVVLEKQHQDMRSQYDQFNQKNNQTKNTNKSETGSHFNATI